MQLRFRQVQLTKRYPLRISRELITGSLSLFVFVDHDGLTGVGEMCPGQLTGAATAAAGEAALRQLWESGVGDLPIHEVWQRGRELGTAPCALAALDVALWDLQAKRAGLPLYRYFGLSRRQPPTSVTIGINPPEVVRERVPELLRRTGARFLKVKLGSPEGRDADQALYLAAQAAAAPFGVGLRVDANGGWDLPTAQSLLPWLAAHGVEYVEQPLPQGAESQLPELFRDRPLPLFVDESCAVAADVPRLAPMVDGINVKLMKCGGLTEALRLVAVARAHGLRTMIGCMGESSVAISAGAAIGALFDYIDLDSHLNLNPDPATGATLADGVVTPPERPGHGARLDHVEA